MTLADRATVHAESFAVDSFAPFYARQGTGPDGASDYRVPQQSSCVVRRILSRMYLLNYHRPRAEMVWRVKSPSRIVVVDLREERLCVRMRHLVFFEEGLRLSTIVNAQVPWLSFESPLVTCLSGTGRVGVRVDGQVECIAAREPQEQRNVNLLRLAAWSADTRLGVAVEPGYGNTVLVAPAVAVVRSSSLVIADRADDEPVGASGYLRRLGQLVVP